MRVIRAKSNRNYKVRNMLRAGWWQGYIVSEFARLFSRMTGIKTLLGELRGEFIGANGERIDLGVLSRRLVTDAFVAFVVDDWDGGASDISLFNYHGCGTGTNAENQTDSALQTECTTALNPDSTRATGTKSQPTAPQMRSVGTVTFDAGAAVTEHGVFSQAATGGGTLMDRSVFSAVNVASGDSIQFTYTLTLTAGG
jgi:hypothetical protein